MMISVQDSHNTHWDDLNDLLLDNQGNSKNSIADLISNQIISGDVEYDEGIFMADEFKFKSRRSSFEFKNSGLALLWISF